MYVERIRSGLKSHRVGFKEFTSVLLYLGKLFNRNIEIGYGIGIYLGTADE